MGRPYADELALLGATYSCAQGADVSILIESINALRAQPLVVVGSGGSLSACSFVGRLHETHARLPARVLTPLEFIRLPVLQAGGVLLLSAGGSNPDILAAAVHAISSEYTPVVGLCTRAETQLKAFLAPHRHAAVFEFVGPSTKDGFLATNSLLLTCTLLARGYGVALPATLPALDQSLPKFIAGGGLGAAVAHGFTAGGPRNQLCRPNVLALADGWAVPAALDLESKWAESGFGTVTVTDVRNFAHGRHHGLARRLAETLTLGLAVAAGGDADERAAGKRGLESDDVLATTLSRLPKNAAVSTLRSPLAAEAGTLDLLVRVIHLAGEAGDMLGFDPGRPRVPAFGRALYRAGLPRLLLRRAKGDGARSEQDLWIRRKVTPVMWASAREPVRESWREKCQAWISTVESARIGGLVLDYDGTMCEAEERFGIPAAAVGTALTDLLDAGMVVGVATGRGDSIVNALRAILPERVWAGIIVGMYNGSVRFRLHEQVASHTAQALSSGPIAEAVAILAASSVIAHVARIQERPAQATVHGTYPLPQGLLGRLVVEALDAAASPPPVDVFTSGHSVDIIARCASKLLVVADVKRELAGAGRPGLAVMTIGDQGQASGNDAPFLAQPLGLSVEYASSALNGCWNVAPQGARRTAALLGYLSAFRLRAAAGFRWSTTRASRLHLSDSCRSSTAAGARASAESTASEEFR